MSEPQEQETAEESRRPILITLGICMVAFTIGLAITIPWIMLNVEVEDWPETTCTVMEVGPVVPGSQNTDHKTYRMYYVLRPMGSADNATVCYPNVSPPVAAPAGCPADEFGSDSGYGRECRKAGVGGTCTCWEDPEGGVTLDVSFNYGSIVVLILFAGGLLLFSLCCACVLIKKPDFRQAQPKPAASGDPAAAQPPPAGATAVHLGPPPASGPAVQMVPVGAGAGTAPGAAAGGPHPGPQPVVAPQVMPGAPVAVSAPLVVVACPSCGKPAQAQRGIVSNCPSCGRPFQA